VYDLTAMSPARASIAIGPLKTRTAKIADAAAIAEIYNQGIADRIATFETEPRSARDIAEWFTGEHLAVVAETGETGLIVFAASFPIAAGPATAASANFRSM
jgi:L-amino acid N-acyltransferase YncA